MRDLYALYDYYRMICRGLYKASQAEEGLTKESIKRKQEYDRWFEEYNQKAKDLC